LLRREAQRGDQGEEEQLFILFFLNPYEFNNAECNSIIDDNDLASREDLTASEDVERLARQAV
jgi:hypothetical protein